MKKILTNILAAFLLITTVQSVSAEVSQQSLADVIHTAEDTAYTELLEGKIDCGRSMSETDILCSDIDFSKMYRRYPLLYNESYKERLSGSGLLKLVYDEPIDTYFGYGLNDNELYRLHFADTAEVSVSNPEEYRKFSQCYAVLAGGCNYSLEDYAEVLADIGVSEVYDAYLAAFYIYSKGNDYCHIAYFDTDKGEYVMNIAEDRTEISSYSEEELEYLTLYPIDKFFEKVDMVLHNVSEYNKEKSSTRTNEDGDEVKVILVEDENGDVDEVTVVQKPVKSEDGEELKKSEKEETADEPEEEEKPEESEDKDEELKKPEEKEEAEKPKSEEEKDIGKPEKNDIDVMLHGKQLSFIDQKPIIENDRVLVPFRVIFEALEADVTWDGDTKTVTAVKGGSTISITIGENKITKNGEEIEIDVPARIINERTLVPIRVISESFENTVSWDGTNRIVEIK